MKTTITVLLIIALAIGIAAMNSPTPSSTEITILHDVTDSLLAGPDTAEIIRRYDFQNHPYEAAGFRYVNLTDVSYNHVFEVSIPSEEKWLSNEFEREKSIASFKTSVTEIISKQDSIGKTHSSIYLPLAHELTRLNQSKASTRLLLVYSDLMENDERLSFYDTRTFKTLQDKPEFILHELEQMETLPRLNGITVYFIYEPHDSEQDRVFKAVSSFYRSLLESKGATVYISANL